MPFGERRQITPSMSSACARMRPPSCFTSVGSFASACATRFCTLTMSISRSLSTSNETFRLYVPVSEHEPTMYSMSSTPFTSSSIGMATVLRISFAFAPG